MILAMTLLHAAQILQDSALGTTIRESNWWYAVLNVVHVLALMVAAGSVMFFDLRLLGCSLKRTPVSEAAARLLPWTWRGFAVMALSGFLLISSEAERLYFNTAFRVKLVCLILAGLNVLVFHATTFKSVAQWDHSPVTPLRARMAGAASLVLWTAILASGRMIGYTLDT
jgi:NhaP-type Na+/H+ and K+/H+ antiporter